MNLHYYSTVTLNATPQPLQALVVLVCLFFIVGGMLLVLASLPPLRDVEHRLGKNFIYRPKTRKLRTSKQRQRRERGDTLTRGREREAGKRMRSKKKRE